MSKKSRRRNKKILATLAAIGTGLALANRGKGTEMSNINVDSGRGGESSSAKQELPQMLEIIHQEKTIILMLF